MGSVSSKLNYLVVGEDAGSKLEKAKKLTTVHVISEEEFIKMLSIQENLFYIYAQPYNFEITFVQTASWARTLTPKIIEL